MNTCFCSSRCVRAIILLAHWRMKSGARFALDWVPDMFPRIFLRSKRSRFVWNSLLCNHLFVDFLLMISILSTERRLRSPSSRLFLVSMSNLVQLLQTRNHFAYTTSIATWNLHELNYDPRRSYVLHEWWASTYGTDLRNGFACCIDWKLL